MSLGICCRLAALEQTLAAGGGGTQKRPPRPSQQQEQQPGRSAARPAALAPPAGGSSGPRISLPSQGPAPQAVAAVPERSADPLYVRLDTLGLAGSSGPLAVALGLPAAAEARDGRVISSLLEDLLATNPRAFDARAAIGLKVQDRTLLLDNPVRGVAGGARGGRRQRRHFGGRLATRRQRRELGLYELAGTGLT